jgi:hypothetical protein
LIRTIRPALLGLTAAFAAAGCGAGSYPVPPADLARTALDRSLTAWRGGDKPGPLAGGGGGPEVHVVDTTWQTGRKLDSYEIVREEAGEGDHRFDVRLKLREPAADQEARYVVLGGGPIWVYREEDYRKMGDMSDNPVPDKAKRRRK